MPVQGPVRLERGFSLPIGARLHYNRLDSEVPAPARDPKGEPQLMGADILIVDAEAAIAGLVEACLKTTASLSPSSAL